MTNCKPICDYFKYSSGQAELLDFSDWLIKFIEINKRLNNEDDIETRGYLINQISQPEDQA